MNQNANPADSLPTPAEGSEEGLHQALSDLESLLNRAGAGNARQNEDQSSEAAFDDDSPGESEEREEPAVLPKLDSEVFQSLAGQLTDEIRIIVQSHMEEAFREVGRDIAQQVKMRLDTMLPVFLEDLTNAALRGDEPDWE